MYSDSLHHMDVSNFPLLHSRSVSRLAYALARGVGLPEGEAQAVRTGAFLHDIGKMAIPRTILDKPGPLDEHEWNLIYTHPVIGTMITQSIRPLCPYTSSVLFHHERWDGKGYPNGLKGTQIPFTSQVIAIADAFHAMTNDRPYRKALSIPVALQHIEDSADIQWSEELVMVLMSVVRFNSFNEPSLNPATQSCIDS